VIKKILPAFILAASLSQQRQRQHLLPGQLNLPPLWLKPHLPLAQPALFAIVGDLQQTAVQQLQTDAGAHLKSHFCQPFTRNVHLRHITMGCQSTIIRRCILNIPRTDLERTQP